MKKRDELPADERFLHRFATLKFKVDGKTKKKDDDEEDWEIESVNSEEFDAIIGLSHPTFTCSFAIFVVGQSINQILFS